MKNLEEQYKRSVRIARLNDEYRKSMEGCTVTQGIVAMGPAVTEVFTGVRNYKDFVEDDDPRGEHDFGSLTIQGEAIFWKIEYYDESLKHWCDPLDPDCQRVITIMLAEEW